MKLKISIIVIFIFVFAGQSKAQCCGTNELMVQQLTASPFNIYYTRYEYNPFYLNKWVKSAVTVNSGETYANLKLKYDLHKNEFVYYNERLKKLLVIDDEIISSIHMFDDENKVIANIIRYCPKSKGECEFYFVHHSDSISFWSVASKKIEKYNDISRASNFIGGFYLVTKRYIVINDNFIALPKSKRAMAILFPSNKRAIISYINSNKLSIKNDTHLKTICIRINELERQNKSVYEPIPDWMFWKH